MCASYDYEVTLGPAAWEALMSLPDPLELADALRVELFRGPNEARRYEFEFRDGERAGYPYVPRGVTYTAVPLSVNGCTAVFRPMIEHELNRLAAEQERPVAARGFYVVDILPAESAFSRPRPL